MHAAVAAVLLAAHAPLHAEGSRPTNRPRRRCRPPSLPYSRFASPQAREKFAELLAETREGKGPDPADLADQRRFYQRYNDDRLREVERAYRSRVQSTRMGGVPVQVVDPQGGASGDNAHRVLINLHGGAFMWGAGSGALVEAIPIAAVAGMRVVAVDYRLAPEHTYPAAVDDVEAVYRELLKSYRPENIGIYGCSAGGALTAQATARILQADAAAPRRHRHLLRFGHALRRRFGHPGPAGRGRGADAGRRRASPALSADR